MGTEQEARAAVRALAMAGRGLERAAAPLTLPQYRVLAFVAAAPERASRLAEKVDVTKAALTGVLDSLVAHGWVSRSQVAGDRRGVSLGVTDAGAAALAAAEAAMAAWLTEVVDGDERALDGIARLGAAMAARRDAAAVERAGASA